MTGAILAGGLSSRFGSNKALALFQGRPLIKLLADKISDLFTSRLLVTNSPEEYAFLNIPMTGDIHPGLGPLAGIHAALLSSETPYTFICACDMPLLSERLIKHLHSFTETSEYDIILPVSEKGPEPLYTFYHKRLIQIIESHIKRGERKVVALFDNTELAIKRIEKDEVLSVAGDMTTFYNINQQDDLASLEKMM
jgi:molybdopterin-guanine dinucleotide biosynthesis protein A